MNKEQLNANIAQISNATAIGENTAERVGTTLGNISEMLFENAYHGLNWQGNVEMKMGQINSWLDSVRFTDDEENLKKLGHCKLFSDGVNIEVYNFVMNFAKDVGSQLVFGSIQTAVNGNAIALSATEFNMIYRRRENGTWTKWTVIVGGTPQAASVSELPKEVTINGSVYTLDEKKALELGLYNKKTDENN